MMRIGYQGFRNSDGTRDILCHGCAVDSKQNNIPIYQGASEANAPCVACSHIVAFADPHKAHTFTPTTKDEITTPWDDVPFACNDDDCNDDDCLEHGTMSERIDAYVMREQYT